SEVGAGALFRRRKCGRRQRADGKQEDQHREPHERITPFPGPRFQSPWHSGAMATMADLDELALSLPQATKDVSDDGRPSYLVHGKLFCCHRSRRRDAIDPQSGERLDDVLMFRVADLGVKDLMLADERGVFFTTPHFDGYPAVLLRIPDLARLDRD